MGTANQIIDDALKKIGVWETGRSATAEEAADGLRALNLLIDSWSNENLMLFQFVQRTKALTAGDATYTIGSSGDIDTTRPVRIHTAFIRDASNDDSPLEIVNTDDFSKIPLKSVGNAYPVVLHYRPAYPLATITLYPEPSTGLTLYLECWDQITQFTALTTSASLPPGYERALIYNLAVELAPEYGVAVPQEVMRAASDSKSRIKDVNDTEVPVLESDLLLGGINSRLTGLFPF